VRGLDDMYVFLGWLVLSILLAAMALGLPCRSVHKPKAFEDKYVTTIWNSNVHFVNPKSAKTEQTDLHSTTALIPSVSITAMLPTSGCIYAKTNSLGMLFCRSKGKHSKATA
jgi:hypothetical protein